MVLGHEHDVPGRAGLLGLALHPREQLLPHHAGRDVLVAAEPVLVGGILAGVDHDERDALGGAHHVGEAAALAAALIEHGDRVVVAAIGVQLLELKRVDEVGVLRLAAREITAVVVVVDVVVAVDHAEHGLLAGIRQLLFGRRELIVHVLMADELAVLREVAGKDHQVGLIRHDLGEGLVNDGTGLAEHLAVGVLGDREVSAIRVQLLGEVVHVGQMRDLDLIGVVRASLGRLGRRLIRIGGHRNSRGTRPDHREPNKIPATDFLFQHTSTPIDENGNKRAAAGDHRVQYGRHLLANRMPLNQLTAMRW